MSQATHRVLWVIVVLAGAACVALLIGNGDKEDDTLMLTSDSHVESESELQEHIAETKDDDPEARSSSQEDEARNRERINSDRPVLSGQVIEKGTGEPIKSFHFRLRRKEEKPRKVTVVVNETIHDEDGRFSFSPLISSVVERRLLSISEGRDAAEKALPPFYAQTSPFPPERGSFLSGMSWDY